MTDTKTERSFYSSSDMSDLDSSEVDVSDSDLSDPDFIPDKQIDGEKQIDGDKQIDGGKQMVTDKEESQTSSKKSRKRKRNSSRCTCCTCPRHSVKMAKTEKRPLPKGYGYVPWLSLGRIGPYHPSFTNQIGYMTCARCGINGDHWEPFCLNPINDPPEEEAAADPVSWKNILGNFNAKEYLEKQKLKSQGKQKRHVERVVKTNGRLPGRVISRRLCA
ncbi:PREDICTED: uncharacterized protein LOC101294398 [Fragaria vesca subsp. vesca]|uniref:uncharacterized protein LOC101294398 n=1 Tax=Fragaria vesca subsp. vesca TaxID=101020 RepID=UPI0002C34BE0|nr:PREDICTED: uncharacterized protein LOC101294398 [Fragaria vesca subsp. vesca]